ncbi:hypothetical protein AWH56_002690 [Anaerobacillus isosaccharinicus]|uniref:DUF4440 domain-containing protein n=1 Tax=Anaerobacillus isosaccharinicus TaxID=1532552 RepID=A0A1S2L6W0_9BACI|nr:hypothetical protein [Anaerobacillus isosaccharinicus]MBA5585049.1 hypothetical protein [Anaerobacillus isosaccharinicus]QOY36604.1 hypothetical protein AWH56_002690 [Anaerobacillus isosaccharinicus]
MKKIKGISSILGAAFLAMTLVACSESTTTEPVAVAAESTHVITETEVLEFQQSWGEGIVHIGEVFTSGGDYETAASEHINRFYGYEDMNTVLFKPTLAKEVRHRDTFESAMSYFIGGDISEDKGFAITPWTNVRWENEGVIIEGNQAVTMGVYYFTPGNGGEPVEVEYTFAYTKNNDGELKIVLHSSHLPFSATKAITEEEVLEFQQSWGEGIVHIGEVFTSGGDYEAAATEHINRFYGYDDMETVLFKPTLAKEVRHRGTFESALSYFVGGDIAEDKGFAITPWTDVRWENEGVQIEGNKAVTMGVYYFTPANGGEPVEVEYTFAFTKNNDGDLKITLHSSHLPFGN